MPYQRTFGSVSLKELRANPEGVARRVRSGEVVLVVKRSTPLFRLIKPFEDGSRIHRRR